MINKELKNRYKILKIIGRGGFGITFLAQDRANGESLCVVKQLNPYHAEIATAKRLFQREADTLKELKEADQIPEFIEYFEENDNYYIVQEYIEGKTLDRLIDEHWDAENLSRFLWDVLSVLEKLHRNNIIHRDIKPSNLIKSDRNCKIVVIDFGAVKQLDSQNTFNSSQENRVLNPPTATKIATAEYAPPEQKRGKPLLNSDIYALGMTALQLLTKQSPIKFERDSNDDIVLDKVYENVDRPLLAILNKMAKKNPQERYQSASEVLKAIDLRKNQSPKQIDTSTEPISSIGNHPAPNQTEPISSTVTEPIPSIVKNPTSDRTQPLSSTVNHSAPFPPQTNSNNINYDYLEEKQTNPDLIANRSSNNIGVNSQSSLFSPNHKIKPFLIFLFVIGLIAIIGEFVSPWLRPAYFIHRGNRLLSARKAEESLEKFYQVTSLQENSFGGWKGQGDALFTLGRISGALGAYEKANSIEPNNLKTLNNIGKAYYEQGNYQKALDTHQQVLDLDEGNAEAFSGQGIAYLGLQEYQESLAAFDEAKKIKPNEPDIWLKQAIALRYLNRPEEAEALYEEALNVYNSITKNNKTDPVLWTDRGFVLQQLNRQQEALDSYEKALAVDENFYEALLGKANTLVVLQKPEDALFSLEKAAESRPEDYQVWYTKGTILEQVLKRHQEALNDLEKATELNPKFAPAWLNKGLSLIALERFDEALISLDKARELEPENPYVLQNRELVLQKLGS